MNISTQLAKHLRDVYFGGNWTSVNFKENLADVTWQEANTQVHGLNTIALLVFHTGYYISAVIKVLQGGPLDASDKYSFDAPRIGSQEGWETMLNKTWSDVEVFATLVEQLPEERIWEDFAGGKYGSYYRNIQGITEHAHYHLGQVAIIKKMIREGKDGDKEKGGE